MNVLLLISFIYPSCWQSICQNEGGRHDARSAARVLSYSAQMPSVDRATLEAVYQLPDFEQARNRSVDTSRALLAQLNVWLDELLETSGAETFSETTRLMVFAIATLLGMAAILRFISGRKKPKATLVPQQTLLPVAPVPHLMRARQALRTHPRLAIREGLFALLVFLEQRHQMLVNRAKTNRELALELSTRASGTPMMELLGSLLQWYDSTFYSLQSVKFEDAQRFLEQIETLAALPTEKKQ